MNKTSLNPSTFLLSPPVSYTDIPKGAWFSLPDSDPITDYVVTNFWDQTEQPCSWQAVELSPAVYIYREQTTGWAIVAKFHSAKTGADAEKYAVREYQFNQQAREVGTADNGMCAVRPYGFWQGTIFLEYVDGLTLEDKIAVRRSQPGELSRILENVGTFLANFHAVSLQPESRQDFGQAADYAYKLVDNLVRHGVIQNNPIVQNGFGCVIEKWATDRQMWTFQLTLTHGDATTSNFIFPPEGSGVAIDWERSEFADPAADLGRLMAEVTHSINQHGGNFAEGQIFAKLLAEKYCDFLPSNWNGTALLQRAQFYQATSTLRIARNGWLSRIDRLSLILHAFALLQDR
jgi:aminoglycoside phosphotransferase (APT) family kinase protein